MPTADAEASRHFRVRNQSAQNASLSVSLPYVPACCCVSVNSVKTLVHLSCFVLTDVYLFVSAGGGVHERLASG